MAGLAASPPCVKCQLNFAESIRKKFRKVTIVDSDSRVREAFLKQSTFVKSVINRLIPAKANHEAIEVLFVRLYLNFPKGPCLIQVKEHLDPIQTYLAQIDLASLVTHYNT